MRMGYSKMLLGCVKYWILKPNSVSTTVGEKVRLPKLGQAVSVFKSIGTWP